jgi:branched-subunit amino acid transport protein
MTHGSFLWLVVLVSLATYATRFPFIVLGRLIKLTPRLKQGLDYIPIGVFAAMVGPAIFSHVNPAHGIDVAFLVATVMAFVVAFFTKSPMWTMIAGVLAAAGVRLL